MPTPARRLLAVLVVLVSLVALGGTAVAGRAPGSSARAATAKAKQHATGKGKKHASKKAKKHPKKKAKKHKAARKPKPVAVAPAPAVAGTALIGTFKLTPGAYSASGGATGSYLRMILPGGTVAGGPFFANLFSSSADPTFTLITPGTDGGLVTGSYQPPPSPAFGGLLGDALANRIMAPQPFEVIKFSAATAPVDPQTGRSVPPPSIIDSNGVLSGNLAALSAEWSSSYFNQGSPKPDGSSAGLTTPVAGVYDATTGQFIFQWASTIVGGAFNGFTGFWRLAGFFQPSAGS